MKADLKRILGLRDKSFKVYDYLRFKGCDAPFGDMQVIHNELTILLFESLGGYKPIHATEDCIIKPGETREIQTDLGNQFEIASIEDNKALEFTNEGIISTLGHLSFELVRDYENGNKISVTNNVPREAEENYDLCGYHYCDATTTRYFGPGIYCIPKGELIGVAGFNKDLELDPPKVKVYETGKN